MGASAPGPAEKQNNLNMLKQGTKDMIKNYILIDADKQKLYESIPNDQYVCPICGEIPQLVNIHSDNGNVEFKCHNDGELILNIEQYFKKLSEPNLTYYNTKCCKCNAIQKSEKNKIFKYCYLCKDYYCLNCLNKEEHPKKHLEQCVPVNVLSSRCKEHYNEEYTSFCRDCKENVCEKLSSKQHRGHNITNFFKIENKKKIILEKNKLLSSIIKFNELILNTYEKSPDNYYHIINLTNLAESISTENARDSIELEVALKNLELKIKNRKSVIEEFNKKFKTSFNGKEESISLINRGLQDNDFKLLTRIGFPRLKDLDVSQNKITDIESLKDMNTSYLRNMNFNDNAIKSIGVLESLDLKSLQELQLKNNSITSVSTLLRSDLPALQFIRLEGNDGIDRSMDDFKKVLKKYTKKIIYVVQTYEDFNKKYDAKISEKSKIIDLRDKETGNDVLKDLYLISSNYDSLKKLDISGCKIDDISLLSRISFKSLETLDLSMNNIKNIDIFSEVKFNSLKCLFLNDNKISNITPLKALKCKSLTTITIKENNIVPSNKDVQNIVKYFKDKNIHLDIE